MLAGQAPLAKPLAPRWARRGALAVLLLAAATGLPVALWVGRAPAPDATVAVAPPAAESEAARLAERGWQRRRDEPVAAAVLLGQALALEPGRHDWRLRRGLVLWAAGRNAEAAARTPGDVGRLARGLIAALRGRETEARDELAGVTGWEAALVRAQVSRLTDPALALREYTNALTQGLRFTWALTNRGNLRLHLNDVAGAVDDYAAALALDPQDVDAVA